jgi:hypothetical protein
VEDREGRGETRVAKVGVEGCQLVGGAHGLVGQAAKRHRGHVGAQSRRPDGAFNALARPVAAGLGLGTRHRAFGGDDRLLDHRRRGAGEVTESIGLNRDRAPVDQVELLGAAGLIEEPAGEPPLLVPVRRGRVGEEDDGHPELDGRLDVDGGALHPVAHESLGDSQQETSAIARAMIRGHRSSMTNTMQRCEGGIDDTSAGSPSSVSDETDPAGVVLIASVVQACVSQDEVPTLSAYAAPSHGRLHQKDGAASYQPHKGRSGLSFRPVPFRLRGRAEWGPP